MALANAEAIWIHLQTMNFDLSRIKNKKTSEILLKGKQIHMPLKHKNCMDFAVNHVNLDLRQQCDLGQVFQRLGA